MSRLIDADAFKEYICNAYEQVKHMYPDGGKWAKEITEDFCKDIDEQPTIDISNNSNTLGALDCVERQAEIDALDEIRHALWEIDIPLPTVPEYVEHHEQVQSVWKLLDKKQKELYVLPSVQPRKGKWTRHFDGNEWYWYCSSCKEQWYEEDLWMGGNSFPNFCPNCGADMRGDSE